MSVASRDQFLNDYRVIRHAEGRGSDDPAYYQALPFEDLTGRNSAQWAIRGKSYRYFEHKILPEFEKQAAGRSLNILDLGAGNGWMSYRLTLRGHQPIAVDIFSDARDGLRAARNYPRTFPVIEAEYDHLPVAANHFDLAIYNSSFHYSTNYQRTLSEVRRCLRAGGAVIIMDSPVYARRELGMKMVAEKHEQFHKQYGFKSDAMPSLEFLDESGIRELARDLQLEWRISRPWYGWAWHLRPLKAKLARRRPPSRFWILIGRFLKR